MTFARTLVVPAALLTGLALAGCTTTDKPVDLGNGVTGYYIACGGLPIAGKGDCDARAAHICGDNGYTVLKEEDPLYAHTERWFDETTHDITITCNTPQSQQTPQIR